MYSNYMDIHVLGAILLYTHIAPPYSSHTKIRIECTRCNSKYHTNYPKWEVKSNYMHNVII
jgi:hypothetical protein